MENALWIIEKVHISIHFVSLYSTYHHLKFPLQWFYGNFMTSNEVQPCKTQNHEIILINSNTSIFPKAEMSEAV